MLHWMALGPSFLKCKRVAQWLGSVQDAFIQSANGVDHFSHVDSTFVSSDVVSAVLQSHNEWEAGAQVCALTTLQSLPQRVDTDFD